MATFFSPPENSPEDQQSFRRPSVERTFWSTRAFAAFIGLYRWTFKPFMMAFGGVGYGCRYHPSCSQYALEAVQEWGFLRGSWLAVVRIFRCNPWLSRDSWDPIPKKTTNLRVSVG
jgi:putative membrane protein insertion efficiency factor